MTATLTARGLGASRGARTLFDGLDLVVAAGDVWGLTGPNGAGKSTLLHALAGVPDAEMTGQVTVSPPDATVGLLRQEGEAEDDEVVRSLLHRVTGVADAQALMDCLAEQMAGSDQAAEDYGDALERWLALGDMRELGEDAAALHAEVGRRAKASGIARLYTLGELSAAAAEAFGEGARTFADHAALTEALRADLAGRASAREAAGGEGAPLRVLVKGSRGSAMDRIVNALLAQGDTTHAA